MTNITQSIRFMAVALTNRMRIKSERGATAVEYGLMVALIAAVIIVAVVALGKTTNTAFDCTNKNIVAKGTAAGC